MRTKASISSSSLLFYSLFLLSSSFASAFNITRLLGRHPDFSTFNAYLTQTKLYADINHRRTITVLAIANQALSTLSGKSTDVIKTVLSLHVILDYYDLDKLQNLDNNTALLTTLLQTSGSADGKQGFLNVTDLSGEVVFGSAVKGAGLSSKLIRSVAAQPYNISVLQISAPIVYPGIGVDPYIPPPTGSPVYSPAEAPLAESPDESEAPAPSDFSDGPSADGPSADAPSDGATAPSPVAVDAPLSSPPSPSPADGPTGDADASAPGPSEERSSATRVGLGTCLLVAMGMAYSSFFALNLRI